MAKKSLVAIALVLAAFAPVAPPAASGRDVAGLNLYLRRATFDPLRSTPQISSAMRAGPSSRLAIAQFDAAPTGATRAALAAAGRRPLVYIPDNALLVDAAGAPPSALAGLPGLRWYGPFQDAYKLPADLDSALNGQETADLDLRLLGAPGADVDGLAADLAARGGAVLGRGDGLNGASLRVRLPAASLRDILRRDDVLWVERYVAPRVFNDKAREIVGVTAARQQLGWLTGAGQIVAVTDTGLDVQGGLSADFAGRVAAAFTPAQMSGASFCGQYGDPTTWSDRNGHGTHVAGTVLGSGALSPSGQAFAGVAPGARLVVQAVSTGGRSFDCLSIDTTFLTTAYGAGARVQNASWGGPTGGTDYNPTFGGYTQFASDIDSYLWNHKDHLLVVAAGNDGKDTSPRDGVIDADSIGQPATAKNVLTVGASESNRPPTGSYCFSSAAPESWCYSTFVGFAGVAPFAGDYIGDNINGIAAFSSRGPAADGRIKPEIVAPGTIIVSSASHDVAALYDYWYPGSDYAYDSGTSMAAPVVSGAAALVRQWLAQARQISAPSAALIKAMLLNG
ncbi:MAG TPA: S8 family serine peptidase, partial [Roseiflexaceae bacterium]